jgi:hypothetical protein
LEKRSTPNAQHPIVVFVVQCWALGGSAFAFLL